MWTDAVTANCSSISLPRLAYTHSSVIGTAILPTRLQLAVRNHHDQLRYTSFLAPSPPGRRWTAARHYRSSNLACSIRDRPHLATRHTPSSPCTVLPDESSLCKLGRPLPRYLVASLSRYPSQTSAGSTSATRALLQFVNGPSSKAKDLQIKRFAQKSCLSAASLAVCSIYTMPATKIAPSVLASDLGNLNCECKRMMDSGADWLHMDIMDGHFVPNIVMGATRRRLGLKSGPQHIYGLPYDGCRPG
ncbi:hypothetical protein L1887_59436 [Cichorium endivia]|nr:hypothetical protein L1887_59436 [Cichorium endivia]